MARETITINSVDYDSNVSLADADAYLAVNPQFGAAWAAETDDDERGKLLVAATRRLDLLSWAIDLDTDTIPEVVKNATALMAAEIQAKPAYASAGSNEDRTKRLQAGKVSKELFRSNKSGAVPLQSETVYKMVYPCLSAATPLADPAGTAGGTSSQFTEDHQGLGLNNGLS